MRSNKDSLYYTNANKSMNSGGEKSEGSSPSSSYKSSVPLLGGIGIEKMNRIGTSISRLGGNLKLPTFRAFSKNEDGWWKNDQPLWNRIYDPSSEEMLMWNRIFLFACLVALFVDPLLFYLPEIDQTKNTSCMRRNLALGGVVTFFRTITDAFYFLHVFVKFRMAFVSPSSRVFGRGELIRDRKEIGRRYIRSGFFFDLTAALPIPQIVIWFIIPVIQSSRTKRMFNTLQLIVLLQYVLRMYLIFRLSSTIIKAAGVVTRTAWAGAAYNLLLYMLASHVLGAAWYLLSIERFSSCWKTMCKQEVSPVDCRLQYLDCSTVDEDDRRVWANTTTVFSSCDPKKENITFDYGIFKNAMLKDVVSDSFTDKFFYCLWWGLQQLSSYGQNLQTSTFVWETSFCIVISIMGLVLFAHLIGNMQTYLQSITSRLEQWRLKRRDTEEWMRHRQLPEHLRQRVRRFVQYKWLATRGVNEESILSSLPTDLRRDIQRHLCLDLVRRVPFFAKMDDQLLDAICERLRSSLSTSGTFIVREGDPVTEMLFIIRGKLESSTTDGGRSGFFNSITLRPGDFCGEELLAWALLPNATNLPSSSRTVRAINEVEAFALQAEHLKFVANQFRRLHSKKLQHTFRYYSHHWRTWAACLIQAAWRRYRKRKLALALSLRESFSQHETPEEEAHDGTVSSSQALISNLGVTILAKRFAVNTRRVVQKGREIEVEMPKLFKPQDPDFSD